MGFQVRVRVSHSAPASLLVKQSCGYVFRMVVPDDPRPVIDKCELRYSLDERSLLHAKRKAKRILAKVKGMTNHVRMWAVNVNLLVSKKLVQAGTLVNIVKVSK